MTDGLSWYLSNSGPRAKVAVTPDLTAIARAVAVWSYDPDDAREASRAIARLDRESVQWAISLVTDDNPLLLSPKGKARTTALPAAVDRRLVPLARKRIREIYPEIADAENTSRLPFREREHPAVRKILDAYYPGSGGGSPRVPSRYPLMLDDLERGLLDLAHASIAEKRVDLEWLHEDARACYSLCFQVSQTCEAIRQNGRKLSEVLRQAADQADDLRWTAHQADAIDTALDGGELPFANSEILPVGQYGMRPKWGLHPLVLAFAKDNLLLYDEIHRYGRVAMKLARSVALRARDLMPIQPTQLATDEPLADADSLSATTDT